MREPMASTMKETIPIHYSSSITAWQKMSRLRHNPSFKCLKLQYWLEPICLPQRRLTQIDCSPASRGSCAVAQLQQAMANTNARKLRRLRREVRSSLFLKISWLFLFSASMRLSSPSARRPRNLFQYCINYYI